MRLGLHISHPIIWRITALALKYLCTRILLLVDSLIVHNEQQSHGISDEMLKSSPFHPMSSSEDLSVFESVVGVAMR
jgi:hypothetical protein